MHLLLLLAWAIPTAAFSCTFDNLSGADISRSAIYCAYPGSEMVSGAAWHAQMDGILKRDGLETIGEGAEPAAMPEKIATTLAQFKARLESLGSMPPGRGLAAVLLDLVLWTRCEMRHGELEMSVHIEGPTPGDVVLVSEYAVIEALAAGSMGFEDAHELGLLRLYGDTHAKTLMQRWLTARK